jgi:hypothetical protein
MDKSAVAWLVFLAGASAMPLSVLLIEPHSVSKNAFTVMLSLLPLIACVGAPFLSTASRGKKLGLAFLGFCAFVLSSIVAVFLILSVHGMPM